MFLPRTCSECGNKATCEYDFGMGQKLACADHDPFRWPGMTACATTTAYWYRSILDLTTTSVSHLGWQAMLNAQQQALNTITWTGVTGTATELPFGRQTAATAP